ncbi:hypothetical protein [Actinoallomurus soli]|uniref:hypothetical protein n=1 Tax=Actinoallomurus soli TaxID=2952535 RepID=UPI002092383E|nr:hypothetical protein [Actinoallomurus soli]MCO5970183.1 hypothetical protein [Actinoallomurus soli]
MVAVTPAAQDGPRPDASNPTGAEPDRPGILRGLLDLITVGLGREPDLHSGDDGHALDEEDEPDGL